MYAGCVLRGLVQLVRKLFDAALKASGCCCRARRVERLGLKVNDADIEFLDLLLEIGLDELSIFSCRVTVQRMLTLSFSNSEFSTRTLPSSI